MTTTDTHPHQILCLEHEETSLYGEVIQVIAKRNLYWLRPLALVWCEPKQANKQADSELVTVLYDLRQGVDLLCPRDLFRVALDTEVIPVLTQLEHEKAERVLSTNSLEEDLSEAQPIAHRQLQAFIRQIWQAQPEAFRQ